MSIVRDALRIGALISMLLPCSLALLAADEAVLIRLAESPSHAGEYAVTVEAVAGSPALEIAAVSFSLAIPAGATDVVAGAAAWDDSPVPAVIAVPGGLNVGMVLDSGHDLAGGPCEIVSFRSPSPAGMAFTAAPGAPPVEAVISTVDGRSLAPYTRVLGGEMSAPPPAAASAGSMDSESGSAAGSGTGSGAEPSESVGEGGMAMLGSEPLPCDAVTIVKELPETYDHWLYVTLDYSEIQDAIDDLEDPFSTFSGVVVIQVEAGTYAPISIDLGALASNSINALYLYATDGPATTIIEGTSTQRPVLVSGNASTAALELYLGLVIADDIDLTDSSNWRGFTIRSDPGGGPVNVGGGVAILDAFPEGDPSQLVELRGNRIVECEVGSVGPNGGGMAIARSKRIRLIRNEIGDNRLFGSSQGAADGDGAGVHILASEVVAVSNWIHGNDFVATTADLAAEGGGLAMVSGSLDLCGNLIEENGAKLGGGVWVRVATGFVGSSFDDVLPRFYARENRVFDNTVWEPNSGGTNSVAYVGGGMFIRTTTEEEQTYTLQVLSNRFAGNDITTDATQPTGVPSEAGGGLYLDILHSKTSGAPEEFPAIESNLFISNTAARDGGGAWLYAELTQYTLQGEQLRFLHNTALLNQLTAGSGERGSGVFFAGEDSLGSGSENVFDASSNISFENEATLGLIQAFAECPDTGAAPWRYSQMEGPGGGGCPGSTGWDLTDGLSVSSANDDADPLFRGVSVTGTGSSSGRIAESSPCVDTAEATSSLFMNAATDFDGQPREFDLAGAGSTGVTRDRGGDEVNQFSFRRGDANGDGSFNIADPIHVLSVLFSGVVPLNCQDAFDANDDELIDSADPTMMLDELFVNPPAVLPAPFGSCGLDPTHGKLVCDFEVSTCP